MAKEYWELVETDPRDWTHDQKVLFWWVVAMLRRCVPGGLIAAPDPAPLTDEQISDVLREVIPTEGDTREFAGESWTYENQLVLMPSSEGNIVQIKTGNVEVINA